MIREHSRNKRHFALAETRPQQNVRQETSTTETYTSVSLDLSLYPETYTQAYPFRATR
jgi:hypothetical protein